MSSMHIEKGTTAESRKSETKGEKKNAKRRGGGTSKGDSSQQKPKPKRMKTQHIEVNRTSDNKLGGSSSSSGQSSHTSSGCPRRGSDFIRHCISLGITSLQPPSNLGMTSLQPPSNLPPLVRRRFRSVEEHRVRVSLRVSTYTCLRVMATVSWRRTGGSPAQLDDPTNDDKLRFFQTSIIILFFFRLLVLDYHEVQENSTVRCPDVRNLRGWMSSSSSSSSFAISSFAFRSFSLRHPTRPSRSWIVCYIKESKTIITIIRGSCGGSVEGIYIRCIRIQIFDLYYTIAIDGEKDKGVSQINNNTNK
eukprot:gene2170-1339_t